MRDLPTAIFVGLVIGTLMVLVLNWKERPKKIQTEANTIQLKELPVIDGGTLIFPTGDGLDFEPDDCHQKFCDLDYKCVCLDDFLKTHGLRF